LYLSVQKHFSFLRLRRRPFEKEATLS